MADTERMDLRMTDVVPAMEEGYRRVGEGHSVAAARTRIVHPPLPPGSVGYGRPWERDLRINPGAIEGIGYGINIGTTLTRTHGGSTHLLYYDWSSLLLKAMIEDRLVHSVRSAAPDGVFARHLARADAASLGLIGSGRIARWAAEAVCAVRPIRTVRVWSPRAESRAECARYLSARLGETSVQAVESAEAAVREAAVVATATAALAPVLQAAWLSPGATVISNTPEELDAETCLLGRIFAVYRHGVVTHVPPFAIGPAVERAGSVEAAVAEIGDVLIGRVPGRLNQDEIILCLNPAYGVHDAVLGRFVYERAVALGLGVEVESEGGA